MLFFDVLGRVQLMITCGSVDFVFSNKLLQRTANNSEPAYPVYCFPLSSSSASSSSSQSINQGRADKVKTVLCCGGRPSPAFALIFTVDLFALTIVHRRKHFTPLRLCCDHCDQHFLFNNSVHRLNRTADPRRNRHRVTCEL